MSTLAAVQRGFRDYLVHGEPDRIRTLVAGERDPMRRIGIYGAAYRLRLKEALATEFTLLGAYIGEDRFDALLEHYIRCHPSRDYNIRRYGHRMAAYLAEAAPWTDQPLLAELARFEWAQGLSFDAPDAEPLGVDAVAAVPADAWATLRVDFHPALHRSDFHWNVHDLWSAWQAGAALPEPVRMETAVPWLFWREGRRSVFASLAPDQAAAIDAARADGDFAAVCEALCAWHPPENVPARVAAELRGWVEAGMVVGVATAGH